MTTIDTDALLQLLVDPSARLIDVRTPEEFAEWSIPGAVNVPLGDEAALLAAATGKPNVLVCAAGARAEEAATLLEARGIDALVLAGGMGAWGRAYDEVAWTTKGFTIVQLRRRGKGCLSYLVGGRDRCIVIDPSLDIERYAAIAAARGWKIAHVADTHLHADHLSGARLLAEAVGAELLLGAGEDYAFEAARLEDGRKLELGGGAELHVLAVATPGHTMGSTVFQVGDVAILTGDTLFLESVGRPDLADKAPEFAASLFDSLHQRLLPLDDDTLVLPGHFGPSVEVHEGELVAARLGDLREELPALSMDRERFVEWAAGQATPRPPNYVTIVLANQGAIELGEVEAAELELGPNRCAVASDPH